MTYLERIALAADHIKLLAGFLADHASNEGLYQLEDADARELVRDLLHTITIDAQQMSLLMEIEAPPSPRPDGPNYVQMHSTYLPPDEAQAAGINDGSAGVFHRRAQRADLDRPTIDVTPLLKLLPGEDGTPWMPPGATGTP